MYSNEKKINVLYTHTSCYIGGGNQVLLSLFQGMNSGPYKPFSIVPECGPVQTELSKLKVSYKTIDIRPNKAPFWSKGLSLFALGLEMRRNNISLVHANDPYTYRKASLGSLFTGARLICHVHHPDVTHNTLTWSFKVPPNCVITPSNYVADLVKSLIPDRPAIKVVPVWNPVDTAWFSPPSNIEEVRNRYNLSLSRKHVSIVGALAKHKGHNVFLKMAKTIAADLPDCEFHIIGSSRTGDANYADSLKHMVAELGIRDKVRFWGFVEKRVARDLIQASDLFVLPTREEGFGLSIAEAQACGVPVLSSSIPPLDEVVAEGITGFLLQPDQPELFALYATKLLRDEGMRRKMSDSARDWVVSRFSLDAFASRITSVYDVILG